MTTDPITTTLRRAAPVPDAALPAELGDALAEMARLAAAEEPVPARARRRPRRLMAIALVGAGIAVPVAVGGTYYLSAHTGVFGKPGFTENDTSEYIDTGAPNFPSVVRELMPTELPVPPGWDWEEQADVHVAQIRGTDDGSGVIEQATGIRSWFAYRARCAWSVAWVRRHDAGDAAGAAEAVRMLDATLTWQPLVATDGGGVIDMLRTINDAAREGRAAPVRRQATLNCGSEGMGAIR